MDISETLKTILLAGVGAVAKTAESSKTIIDELVKKGEITVNQGKVLNEELKHKFEEGKIQSYADAVEKMTKEQRDALRKKLDEVDSSETKEESENNK
jgi:polyhydroxyalkanoate synthesis regulator phasin